MGDLRIPVPIAVALWAASGLAVLSYTYLAFKETAKGAKPTDTPLSARAQKAERRELSSKLLRQLPELEPLPGETPSKPLTGRRFKS